MVDLGALEGLNKSMKNTDQSAAFPQTNPNPVLSFGLDGELQFANPASLELVAKLELEGVENILPMNHKGLLKACTNTHTPLADQRQVDGHTLAWSYHPVDELKTVYVYGHDIFDYQSDIAGLQEMPDANPNPVLSFNSDGSTQFANPAALKLVDDLKLQDLDEILPVKHREIIAACLNTHTHLTGQRRIRDRTIVWSFHPAHDNKMVYTYGHDVSGIRPEFKEKQDFPDVNPSPVLSSGSDGAVKFSNPAALALVKNLDLDNITNLLPRDHIGLVTACLKTRTPLTSQSEVAGRTFAWSYNPADDSDTVFIYGHDISEYRQI